MKKRPAHASAVFVALAAAEDGPSEWVQLLPAPMGGRVHAKDSRWWSLSPADFVAHTGIGAAGLVVDYEHATQKAAKQGIESPAAGWIRELRIDDDMVMARVDWTPRGSQSLADKEYKFISATFAQRWANEGRQAIALLGASLTNDPAFTGMTALAQAAGDETGDDLMNETQLAELRSALGLGDASTAAEIIAAAKARPVTDPGLASSVPRADYDLAVGRYETAEAAIAQREKDDREAAIAAAVDEAIGAGKVAPASRDFHIAACGAEGGLDAFKDYVSKAPAITDPVAAAASQGGGSGSGPNALTGEDRRIGALMGLSEVQMSTEGRAN